MTDLFVHTMSELARQHQESLLEARRAGSRGRSTPVLRWLTGILQAAPRAEPGFGASRQERGFSAPRE